MMCVCALKKLNKRGTRPDLLFLPIKSSVKNSLSMNFFKFPTNCTKLLRWHIFIIIPHLSNQLTSYLRIKKSQNHFNVEGHIKLPSNEQSYFENNKMLSKKEWIQHNFWWSFELSITFIRFETATNVHWHLVYLEDIAQG